MVAAYDSSAASSSQRSACSSNLRTPARRPASSRCRATETPCRPSASCSWSTERALRGASDTGPPDLLAGLTHGTGALRATALTLPLPQGRARRDERAVRSDDVDGLRL